MCWLISMYIALLVNEGSIATSKTASFMEHKTLHYMNCCDAGLVIIYIIFYQPFVLVHFHVYSSVGK